MDLVGPHRGESGRPKAYSYSGQHKHNDNYIRSVPWAEFGQKFAVFEV
jgi:hypothetical protein